jgi:hypothetical protein
MKIDWIYKYMDVGDVAKISGVPAGKAQAMAHTYGRCKGWKFRTYAKDGVLYVQRLNDDGTAPDGIVPKKHVMSV